ncbi:MAG: AAA family ATPase [Bacteroidota bacterium]
MIYSLPRSTLCLVVGVPASGKTSLAQELVRNVRDASYISKDMIQSCFTSKERVSGQTYSMIQGPTFGILVSFAGTQLKLKKHPFIDAPFSVNNWRRDKYSNWVTLFRDVAKEYDARLAIIRCMPPDLDGLRRRIEKRHYEWDKWKLEHWTEFLKQEPVDFPIEHDDVLEIVTDRPNDKIAGDVLTNYLKAKQITGKSSP